MIQINLKIDLDKITYHNIEHRHLELLLFMKNAHKFFLSAGNLLGSSVDKKMKDLFKSLPDDVLNKCGYSKNRNSFEKIDFIIRHTLRKDTYELATSTLFSELPCTKGLEFLKIRK